MTPGASIPFPFPGSPEEMEQVDNDEDVRRHIGDPSTAGQKSPELILLQNSLDEAGLPDWHRFPPHVVINAVRNIAWDVWKRIPFKHRPIRRGIKFIQLIRASMEVEADDAYCSIDGQHLRWLKNMQIDVGQVLWHDGKARVKSALLYRGLEVAETQAALKDEYRPPQHWQPSGDPGSLNA